MKYYLLFFLFLWLYDTSFATKSLNEKFYAHVQNCPLKYKDKIELLVPYLEKVGKTEAEKVEVFFYWIAENIEYDVEALKNGSYNNRENKTLERGKAICQEYAELLEAMCAFVEIECHVISGYAKERFSIGREDYKETNHAWNIIKVDGSYKIVDATWGSGYVNDKDEYKKLIDLKNLFADPDFFSIKRLPGDPRWQFRDYPISLGSFAKFDSVEEMLAKAPIYYNHEDSVEAFSSVDFIQRKVLVNFATYRFNPTNENIRSLGITYSIIAFDLANKESNLKQLLDAVDYYKRAIFYYNKLSDEEEKSNYKKSCYKGIAYAQYYIANHSPK